MTGEAFRIAVTVFANGSAGMVANVPEETQQVAVDVIVQAILELMDKKLPHGARLASMIIVISEQLQRENPGLAAEVRKMNYKYLKNSKK